MRNTLVLTLILASAIANSQAYQGTLGSVVSFPAQIELNKWTRYFKGWYEFVPGVRIGITGRAVPGWFEVDGWFKTRAVVTNHSIQGDGVWLFRK